MKASGGLRQGGVGQVTLGPSDKLPTGERKRPLPCRHSHNSLETQEGRMLRVLLVQRNRTNIRDGERARENGFQQLDHWLWGTGKSKILRAGQQVETEGFNFRILRQNLFISVFTLKALTQLEEVLPIMEGYLLYLKPTVYKHWSHLQNTSAAIFRLVFNQTAGHRSPARFTPSLNHHTSNWEFLRVSFAQAL